MRVKEEEKKTLLADEFLLVRHSGEIPEVALHGSIYYLTEDYDGPRVTLQSDDLVFLKKAVVERYREIILRDLDSANRDKGMYRGIARCVINWQRCLKFCRKEGYETGTIKSELAKALLNFICQEINDVQNGKRSSCVNCTLADFESFLDILGLQKKEFPAGLSCLWEGEDGHI